MNLPKKLAKYQLKWLNQVCDKKSRVVAIAAARGSAKTWTVALAIVFLCHKYRKMQVTIVPGGIENQASPMMGYIREMAPHLIELDSAKRIGFKNGSIVQSQAPSLGGVQSSRARLMVIEEAHMLKREIFVKAFPQLSKSGIKIVFIGILEDPSIMCDLMDAKDLPYKVERSIVAYKEAVAEGVLSQEAIDIALGPAPLGMTREEFASNYEMVRVPKGDYVFQLKEMGELPHGLPMRKVWGIDCNMKPGHCAVQTFYYEKPMPMLVAVNEVCEKEIEKMASLDGEVVIESNGANMGFADHYKKLRPDAMLDDWGGNNKAHALRIMKMMQERGYLYRLKGTCPMLQKGVENTEFDNDGKIVKVKDDWLHYVEGWLHCGEVVA